MKCFRFSSTVFAILWLSKNIRYVAASSTEHSALTIIIHYNNNEMPIDSHWEQIVITNGSWE